MSKLEQRAKRLVKLIELSSLEQIICSEILLVLEEALKKYPDIMPEMILHLVQNLKKD